MNHELMCVHCVKCEFIRMRECLTCENAPKWDKNRNKMKNYKCQCNISSIIIWTRHLDFNQLLVFRKQMRIACRISEQSIGCGFLLYWMLRVACSSDGFASSWTVDKKDFYVLFRTKSVSHRFTFCQSFEHIIEIHWFEMYSQGG